jgi:hypothetical protein
MIVHTKQELENAIKNKAQSFEVEGDLAEKIKKGQKITKLSKTTLALLIVSIAGIAATPVTRGFSGIAGSAGVITIATLTGMEIAVIMTVAFLGVGLLIALFRDYSIEEEVDLPGGKIKLKCTRK